MSSEDSEAVEVKLVKQYSHDLSKQYHSRGLTGSQTHVAGNLKYRRCDRHLINHIPM